MQGEQPKGRVAAIVEHQIVSPGRGQVLSGQHPFAHVGGHQLSLHHHRVEHVVKHRDASQRDARALRRWPEGGDHIGAWRQANGGAIHGQQTPPMPAAPRKLGLEGRHQMIAEPHHRPRLEFLAGLAEGRRADRMHRQPLGQDLDELIQFVLDGAFAQVHQQCHEGRQRNGAVAGEIAGVGAGTRREPLGIQILLDWSIDIFKFDLLIVLLKQRVALI